YKECAVYGELNGVKVAAKPDAVYIYEEDGVKKAHIIDIKTSKDILGDGYGSLQGFDKAVWNMGYYFQVPSYKLLVSLDQGIAIENIDFTFLVAENTLRDGLDKPLCCAYTLSKEYEDYGTKCLQDALIVAQDLQNKNLEEVLENLKKEKQDKEIQLAKQFDNSDKQVQLPAWAERL
ncbi:MAG: PD-(D/E)XK nuclease-like domain-containing protein, partial [Bifidobacteriaceae bacterium]|nr:PD-(D/E)XK nuclease-like domain-containing protein [Bifidobacteriaceae bacterium]